MINDEPMVPCSCMKCHAQLWHLPGGRVSDREMTRFDLPLTFDLIPPMGPGDISMLVVHDCVDEEEGPDDFDPEDYVESIGSLTMSVMGPAMSCRPSYRCPKCSAVSFNRDDIKNRYCVACHVFEGDGPT